MFPELSLGCGDFLPRLDVLAFLSVVNQHIVFLDVFDSARLCSTLPGCPELCLASSQKDLGITGKGKALQKGEYRPDKVLGTDKEANLGCHVGEIPV